MNYDNIINAYKILRQIKKKIKSNLDNHQLLISSRMNVLRLNLIFNTQKIDIVKLNRTSVRKVSDLRIHLSTCAVVRNKVLQFMKDLQTRVS